MRGPRTLPPLLPTCALLAPLALAASGCDILALLLISPFFPGQPLPPPPDLACPLDLAAPAELPPLPEAFTPALPEVRGGCLPPDKPLHRLNRLELDNSLRDLTGLDLQLAATTFPPDDFGGGFDNNASVLAVSPLFMEKLEAAAAEVVRAAMQRPGEVPEIHTFEAETGGGDSRADLTAGEQIVGAGGFVDVEAALPEAAGLYAVRVRAGSDAPDALLELAVDGVVRLRVPVTASAADKQLVEVRTTLDARSTHTLGARHVVKEGGRADGPVHVDFFEVEGPLVVTALGPAPPSRRAIVGCSLEERSFAARVACARDSVVGFARRAWRRPVTDAERARFEALLVDEVRAGDALEDALRTALTAVLLSPHFVYRVEADALAPRAPDGARALGDHALAARLSYFVWSSTPDARLLALADRGALQDPDVLAAETRRMLDDPKSKALVSSFAGQWLFTRAVAAAAPDPLRFPQFDEELRAAMQCETELAFDRYLRDDTLNALDLVTSDETFVNDRLARHYGLEPPSSSSSATLPHGWALVSTRGTGRSGVLGHASLLTVTSQPTRTSPTRRGKFVLENLLCVTPEPPPPGVEGLPEPAAGQEEESVRDRLEQHRADPSCAACHAVIDPIGFGLEHFDAVGRYRGSDAGFAIDDSALYMDTEPFEGARALGELIHDDPLLPFCMAQKTMTYALGAGLDDHACLVEDVAAKFAEGGYKMSDLVVETVLSPAFRLRAATDGAAP